jgi:hypothetical protein
LVAELSPPKFATYYPQIDRSVTGIPWSVLAALPGTFVMRSSGGLSTFGHGSAIR